MLQTVDAATKPVVLLDNDGTVLDVPMAGQHVISISLGEVIDIVIVNKPANSYNGDLTQATSSLRCCMHSPGGCICIQRLPFMTTCNAEF